MTRRTMATTKATTATMAMAIAPVIAMAGPGECCYHYKKQFEKNRLSKHGRAQLQPTWQGILSPDGFESKRAWTYIPNVTLKLNGCGYVQAIWQRIC